MDILLPGALSPGFATFLIVASFFTSALTAAVGIGGGVTLLAIMAYAIPVSALIPVHGVVQLGSNAGRFFIQRAHVAWRMLGAFAAGGIVGALVGVNILVDLPERVLTLMLGSFILLVTWVPLSKFGKLSMTGFGLAGLFTTFLSVFVGATAPLNAAFFSRTFESRLSVVATLSAVMTVQHALKIAAFAVAGFAFAEWVPLIATMIVTGFAGTIAGTRILRGLPEARFRVIMKGLLTVLALDLVRRSIF